jgi:tetratricopeptide (TPR) repeat protein
MIAINNGSGFFQVNKSVFILLFVKLLVPLFAQNNDVQTVLSEITIKLSGRDYTAALALFNDLPDEEARKTEILLMRASISNSAGIPSDAKKIANAVIAKEPENTGALMILADSAMLEGKDRDRRTFLDKVIKIDPNHTRALTDLGNINLGNRALKTAALYFDRAIASDPDYGEALVGRAVVYRYNQEPKKSEQLLNRAIINNPGWAHPWHERSRLYKGAGFITDALQDIEKAKALEPDNYWISIDRAMILFEMNRRSEALLEFDYANSLPGKNFIGYIYSAGLRFDTGDYDAAEKDFARLAKLNPEYYFAYEGLGMIRMKNKNWASARDAFLDAYKQAPKEYSYALLAAVNWMRAGKLSDPKQFLAQVLKTAPRDSLDYAMLRLFHDLGGDADVSVKVDKEQNPLKKSQMLFYLACYYDIRGNKSLADRYYLMVQELDSTATIEWRLNEWILTERGINLRDAK